MHRSVSGAALFVLCAIFSAHAVAFASSAPPAFDPFAVREFREVSISPGGDLVAYVEDLIGPEGVPDGTSAIFLSRRSSDGSWRRSRVTASPADRPAVERDLAWAPDGRRFAFVSDGESPGQFQIYVASAAEGAPGRPRAVTHLRGHLARPQFSPDGLRLAFLWAEDSPRVTGPLEAMTAPSGEIDTEIFEQRLAIISASGGPVDVISAPDLYVHEFCWSPDGRQLAAVAAPGAGDSNWWTAYLETFDIAARTSRTIYRPPAQIALPRWSPDGSSIALVEGLMSDEGSTGGDLIVVPATGGEPRNLTPRAPFSVTWLAWDRDSKDLLVCAERAGTAAILRVPANISDRGGMRDVWSGEESLKADRGLSLSVSADRKASAVIRSSFLQPPEIWAGPTGSWTRVSDENSGIRPAWSGAKSISWSNEGWSLQGWLLEPRLAGGAKAPLAVEVHGGPASMSGASWPRSETAALAAAGYFVFLPNPRGSFGSGEEFTRANVRDFGFGDLRDILSGVDAAAREPGVDPNRVGVFGWSYGGYMTMWAVTQTKRFRAAVAGAGIANWQSYYGENDIDQWMVPYFGASVYDDPNIYARSSPITFIKNVATPTLILASERDGECPPEQSFEFWHALKTFRVPTSLVIYAGEGHALRKGVHQRDRLTRIVSWFDRYLKP